MSASAQVYPTPDVDAYRLPPGEASALRIDGLLNETAWRDAPMASGFRQEEPFEGEPATEVTEVRVLFDDATLYIGILARDRSPDDGIPVLLTDTADGRGVEARSIVDQKVDPAEMLDHVGR